MEASANEFKQKRDKQITQKQKNQFSNPEQMRKFLMQKVHNGHMTQDQVEKAIVKKFGESK